MRLTSLCILLAVAPSAWAEDLNDNGCIDAYEVGTTCVDNSASIGPEVSFSADVIVAPRATLGGRLNHASNPLPIATGVVVARSATVGVDHVLGADTFIGRSSTAGADLTTLTDVSVGYAAQLGHDVTLGANAIVGNLVHVGDYASLGSNAIVARSTTIANAASSGQGSVINGIVGPDGTIEADVRVEFGARVRKQATLLEGARIEATARIGRGARIEAGATVHGTVQANAVVGEGATVGAGAVIERGGQLCAANVLADDGLIESGETYPSTGCGGGLTSLDPGLSCVEILTGTPSSGSGDYWIDPNGGDPSDSFTAYCDMTTDGGGWTQIAFVNTDSEGYNQQYSSIFSSVVRGNRAVGSYKIDASGLLQTASSFRMSEPATTAAVGTADSWATESACDITSAVRGKWQNPGNQNQVPAPITCRDTVTDVIWTEAVQTNYQQWSSPWTGPRLWIGNSHNGAPSYHGDYVAGGLTTWKSSNSTPGVYSGLTANSGNTGDTAAFWLR